MNFSECSDIFSKLNRVLYVGVDHDYDGLEYLAEKYAHVVGIDKRICDTESHVEERKNILKKYPNLQIKEMDARRLKFSNRYFDGVIFKRSLAFIGGEGKVKNEKYIKRALDETYRTLSENGLIWIIYSEADIVDLTLNRMNLLLKSSGFETMEDTKDYKICRKISAPSGI